jgi:hypothetical protein
VNQDLQGDDQDAEEGALAGVDRDPGQPPISAVERIVL